MKQKTVIVTTRCESTNHGPINQGRQTFDEVFANHLIDIGNAVPVETGTEKGKADKQDKTPGKETKPAPERKEKKSKGNAAPEKK